jgi:hypothetical protein
MVDDLDTMLTEVIDSAARAARPSGAAAARARGRRRTARTQLVGTALGLALAGGAAVLVAVSPASAPTARPAQTSACTSDDLTATVADTRTVGAQTTGVLVLTDAVATPCTLSGYPTLTALSSSYQSLPYGSAHAAAPGAAPFVLTQGATASAVLSWPVGSCQDTMNYLLVVLPADTSATRVLMAAVPAPGGAATCGTISTGPFVSGVHGAGAAG